LYTYIVVLCDKLFSTYVNFKLFYTTLECVFCVGKRLFVKFKVELVDTCDEYKWTTS
jgi:hypothetical protein